MQKPLQRTGLVMLQFIGNLCMQDPGGLRQLRIKEFVYFMGGVAVTEKNRGKTNDNNGGEQVQGQAISNRMRKHDLFYHVAHTPYGTNKIATEFFAYMMDKNFQ